ncbi:replication protein A 14 kDa subunit-like [Lethenteron reissneri]|uniref:replication protein A 14 kDa subunit-like n=1 Tax=Lethenteron reissneri TaxID=7753 RepID=UPI002AB783B8|nr:replication protein A 14 kDa subunit-like [Lethenteron reissneri]
MDATSGMRARVNTSTLSQYVGKVGQFLGKVEQVHQSGSSFTMSDGDGQNITVEMQAPLDELLSGVVDVAARVTHKGSLQCLSYERIREDKVPFDLNLYNEAIKISQDFSQFYLPEQLNM